MSPLSDQISQKLLRSHPECALIGVELHLILPKEIKGFYLDVGGDLCAVHFSPIYRRRILIGHLYCIFTITFSYLLCNKFCIL